MGTILTVNVYFPDGDPPRLVTEYQAEDDLNPPDIIQLSNIKVTKIEG